MIPLSSDVYMGYEDSCENPLVYRLNRGGMYFVNISKMHRGFNGSQTSDRINLIMQMTSDQLILDSKPLTPLRVDQLVDLPSYSVEYDVWKFGYEL